MENKKIADFNLPEDKSIIDLIYDILENNGLGLGEDPNKWPDEKEETQAIIIRNAALIIFQKKIPEEKLAELLQKHLGVSKEIAQTIIIDIKEKILPYVRIINSEELNTKNEKLPLGIKGATVEDVDKNAEELNNKREAAVQQNTIGEELQKKNSDKYREPIE